MLSQLHMKRIFLLILSTFFLMGCYQTSLAPMLGPAAGASQGRIAHSAISSGISYGVKNQTGKYPIEYILKREKNKIAKKIHDEVMLFFITGSIKGPPYYAPHNL